MKEVLLDWHLGDNFGWGLLGLNLFLQWANDRELRATMGQPITRASVGLIDPLRLARALPAIERSNAALAAMRVGSDGRRRVAGAVIDALGNDFTASNIHGDVNVGRCIFERTDLSRRPPALDKYDALLVASRWNADLVEAATGRRPQVVFEGVDASLFCPGPHSGVLDDGTFYVYSGGKVEFRKGQDLVLLAFKAFSRRHPDSVLVTAWQSIWPQRSAGFRGRLSTPVERASNGLLDIVGWAARNGIDPSRVVDIGLVPNALMPAVLREMHVAVQPSRAEACTNLPAKEAMACGVPVVAAANTGMKDLLGADHAIVLARQTAIVDADGAMEGWGESDVDEIVAALEFAYAHRDEARRLGLRARDWLIAEGRTWQAHARTTKDWVLSLG